MYKTIYSGKPNDQKKRSEDVCLTFFSFKLLNDKSVLSVNKLLDFAFLIDDHVGFNAVVHNLKRVVFFNHL